jgi:hypothetical protein
MSDYIGPGCSSLTRQLQQLCYMYNTQLVQVITVDITSWQ